MSNYCNECGTKLKENAKFCGECGKPITKLNESKIPAPKALEEIDKDIKNRYEEIKREKERIEYRKKREKEIRKELGLNYFEILNRKEIRKVILFSLICTAVIFIIHFVAALIAHQQFIDSYNSSNGWPIYTNAGIPLQWLKFTSFENSFFKIIEVNNWTNLILDLFVFIAVFSVIITIAFMLLKARKKWK